MSWVAARRRGRAGRRVWSRSGRPEAVLARGRAGCGSSYSCTCRSASATSRRAFSERLVLMAATAVVTTSEWSRRWVVEHYALRPERCTSPQPGVDPPTSPTGASPGGELLCVAAVTRRQGPRRAAGGPRRGRRPAVAPDLRGLARPRPGARRSGCSVTPPSSASPTGSRGPARCPARELDKAYAEADVLVLATRAESWGMVVAESLARGLPVLATEVGGLPEALGRRRGRDRVCWCRPTTRPRWPRSLRRWLERRRAARRPASGRPSTVVRR